MNGLFVSFRFLLLMFLAFSVATPLFSQDEEPCDQEEDPRAFSSEFRTDGCRWRTRFLAHRADNPYWPMEPGWQVVLEGEDDGEEVRVEITVLQEFKRVAGVRTRVIEEREFIDGELYEISRNYFAICAATNDIYYFGEDVDFYEDGEVIGHDGSWLAGVDGAVAGIYMPGTPLLGARFYQEVAPHIAEDRAEVVDMGSIQVGDQWFENAVMFHETSPLDGPCAISTKVYVAGIGMVQDDNLTLVEAGYQFRIANEAPFKQ
ncbi:hypothetical protein [Acanthopleuribacter pedis]|uniref:Uncharacterized protein n=1 Tax=Acanthopleuribacter pedis TaxID=442870 RepID=A0A8J7QF22_9BACT|nr:hypothetical protein [Acanthopleuribacter pedis]MBO1323109.1 hypothetical protein [Acanthopleuribacter pedis]